MSAVAGIDYQAPLTFSFPLSNTSNAVSLAFGTTTGNTWPALQQFANASSSLISVYGPAYFGATATSSFNGAGILSLVSNGLTVGTNQLILSGGNVGIGTTTPGSLLSVGNTNGINFSIATSTFNAAGGINLTGGCFSIANNCVGGIISGITNVPIVTASSTATFATVGTNPNALAFDSSGNLYTANYGTNTVSKVTPGGTVTTFATVGNTPAALAFDSSGNLYVANQGNSTVSEVTLGGSVTTFATVGNTPAALAFDSSGNLYVANFGSGTVSKVTPGGSVSTFAKLVATPPPSPSTAPEISTLPTTAAVPSPRSLLAAALAPSPQLVATPPPSPSTAPEISTLPTTAAVPSPRSLLAAALAPSPPLALTPTPSPSPALAICT